MTNYSKHLNKVSTKQTDLASHLCSRTSLLSELSMDKIKRLMNQLSEYWYMGSMLARSAMEKNKMAEWTAMGV